MPSSPGGRALLSRRSFCIAALFAMPFWGCGAKVPRAVGPLEERVTAAPGTVPAAGGEDSTDQTAEIPLPEASVTPPDAITPPSEPTVSGETTPRTIRLQAMVNTVIKISTAQSSALGDTQKCTFYKDESLSAELRGETAGHYHLKMIAKTGALCRLVDVYVFAEHVQVIP